MQRIAGALALTLLFVAPLAYADQCEIVSPEIADHAVAAILASHGRVLSHCGPCGDPAPSLASATLPHDVHNSGSAVVIDGVAVDLAYTYLEVAPNVFENIALRTGCPAQDVPQVWRFRGPGPAQETRFSAAPPALTRLGWGRTPNPQRLPAPG